MGYSVTYEIFNEDGTLNKRLSRYSTACFSDLFSNRFDFDNTTIRVYVLDDYGQDHSTNENILEYNEHVYLAELISEICKIDVKVFKSDNIPYNHEDDRNNKGIFYEFKLTDCIKVDIKIALTVIRYSFEVKDYPVYGKILPTFFELIKHFNNKDKNLHNLLLLSHYVGYQELPGGHDMAASYTLLPCTFYDWDIILNSTYIQSSLKRGFSLPYNLGYSIRDLLLDKKYDEAYDSWLALLEHKDIHIEGPNDSDRYEEEDEEE